MELGSNRNSNASFRPRSERSLGSHRTPDADEPLASLDGYELRHLVTHLELAGQTDVVHRLLALETPGGRNAWQEAKERAGDTTGFLADVARAWRLADAAVPGDRTCETGRALGRQTRYALL